MVKRLEVQQNHCTEKRAYEFLIERRRVGTTLIDERLLWPIPEDKRACLATL